MTILDLLSSKGIRGRRVASTNGGEWHSPCPVCGGRDRFQAWPYPRVGKREWWCRNCAKGGDQIEFLRHVEGLSFREACTRLGLEHGFAYRSLPQGQRRVETESFTGQARTLPPAKWREKAAKLVSEAGEALFSAAGDRALIWLERRGIEAVESAAWNLGWLEGERGHDCRWRPRSAWGLEDLAIENNGVKRVRKKLWIPRGLVIPTLAEGMPAALRIRRLAADLKDGQAKYVAVAGSTSLPFVALSARAPDRQPKGWVVVESQLDAIMIAERACEYAPRLSVGAMAMLSNTGKPCPDSHRLLARAEKILVALDYDQAGKKGWDWWEKIYPQARRWPTPEGKDPGDYFALGGNIQQWISEGLGL